MKQMKNKHGPKPQSGMLLEWEYCFHVIRFNIVLSGVNLALWEFRSKTSQSDIETKTILQTIENDKS